MAGKIVADTLEHSTAGSIATNYVVEGSAKAWMDLNGTGTISIQSSLNISSASDNGTGDYTENFLNSFDTVSYTVIAGGSQGSTLFDGTITSSTCQLKIKNLSNASVDRDPVCTNHNGDLA